MPRQQRTDLYAGGIEQRRASPVTGFVLLSALMLAGWGLAAGLSRSTTTSILPVPAGTGAPPTLVAATEDSRIVLIDTATGRVLRTLVRADPDWELPNDVELSPDGRTVYYEMGAADPAAGFLLGVPVGGGRPGPFAGEQFGNCPAASPDGTRLAVCGIISVDMIDLINGSSFMLSMFEAEPPRAITWSPDGRYLFVELRPYRADRRVIVVDAVDGTTVRELAAPVIPVPGRVDDVDADASGRHLLVVTEDGELWWVSGSRTKFLGDGWISAAW